MVYRIVTFYFNYNLACAKQPHLEVRTTRDNLFLCP